MIEQIIIFATSRSHSVEHQVPPVEKHCYRLLLPARADMSTGAEWILDLSITSTRAVAKYLDAGLEPGTCMNWKPSAVGQS
jgi:hypothetical protein